MAPKSLFGFWSRQDKDVDMDEVSPAVQRPSLSHNLGRVETSIHPLANLPTTIPKPMDIDHQPGQIPIPLPLPSSTMATTSIPMSSPQSTMTTMSTSPSFAFSAGPTIPLKRSNLESTRSKRSNPESSARNRHHRSNPSHGASDHVKQVEKTRLVEQQALATRAVIDQKTNRINELEAQVESYKTQLDMFMARMNDLEQKLAGGTHAGTSGQVTSGQVLGPMVLDSEGRSKPSTPVDASMVAANRPTDPPIVAANHPTDAPMVATNRPTDPPMVAANHPTDTPMLDANRPTDAPVVAANVAANRPPMDVPMLASKSSPATQVATQMSNAKEKGKEKGKQVIRFDGDDDEEMKDTSEEEGRESGNESEDDTEDGEDDDDGPEMSAPSKRSIPKPIFNYQRPRGGAGPRLKFDPSNPHKPIPNTTPPTNTSQSIPTSVQQSLGMTAEQIAAIVQVVMTVQGQNTSKPVTRPRSKKKNVTGTIVEQSNRQRDPRLTKLVAAIRQHMNSLLRIQNDKDVRHLPQPSKDIVEAFRDEEESEDGPNLVPMRFALGYKKKESWNVRLAEMFVEDFLDQNARRMDITEDEWPIIYEKFWQRFSNLKKEWKSWQNKEGEDKKDVQHRNFLREKKTKATTRRDSRRNHLEKQRVEIALGNRTNTDGSIDEIWDFLYIVATSLGLGGMSSDESSVETGGSPRKYIIKSVEWRSKDLIPYLQLIDRDFNRYNRYGNAKAGNPYRERTRLAGAKASKRSAIKGLPINFYDETWLANLTNEERSFLEPGPKMDLPVIIEYND